MQPQTHGPRKILSEGFVMWRNRHNSRWAPSCSSIDGHASGITSISSLSRSNSTSPSHIFNKSDRLRALNSKKSCAHSLSAAYEEEETRANHATPKPSDHFIISSLARYVEPLPLQSGDQTLTTSSSSNTHQKAPDRLSDGESPQSCPQHLQPLLDHTITSSSPSRLSTPSRPPSFNFPNASISTANSSACHTDQNQLTSTDGSSHANRSSYVSSPDIIVNSMKEIALTNSHCKPTSESQSKQRDTRTHQLEHEITPTKPKTQRQLKHFRRNRSLSRGSVSNSQTDKVLEAEDRTTSALQSVKSTTKRIIRSLTPAQPSPVRQNFQSQISGEFSGHSAPQDTEPVFSDLAQPALRSIDLYEPPDPLKNMIHTTSKPPKVRPTHSRWTSGSHKLLIGLKKKRSQPHDNPDAALSSTTSEPRKPFTLLPSSQRRTSLNDHMYHPTNRVSQRLDPISPLQQATSESVHPEPRRNSNVQSHCLTDLTSEPVSLACSTSNPPRRHGFSFKRDASRDCTDISSSTLHHRVQTSQSPPINLDEPSRSKSPILPAIKPLKSAFGLIHRQEREKSSRHSKSMTNLNHSWTDGAVRKPRALSQAIGEHTEAHHRSYSQCVSAHPDLPSHLLPSTTLALTGHTGPRDEPHTSSKFHHFAQSTNYRSAVPESPTSCSPLTHGYLASDYHPPDPLLRHNHIGNGAESGRHSPTKLALTRLDEIIRGISVPSSTSVMSPESYVSESIPYNPSPRTSLFPARSLSTETPKLQSHSVTSTPRIRNNALSPPMRRHPHSGHNNGPVATTPRSRQDASPVTLYDEGGTVAPAPKKILIKPSAWEHISISASEHRHRRDVLGHRSGRIVEAKTEEARVSVPANETTMQIDDGRSDHSSPLLQPTVSQEDHWQATIGTYRRGRCKLLLEDEDRAELDEEESLVYQTSPSSISSSPSDISPACPEHKKSDGSLLSSVTTTTISEPTTNVETDVLQLSLTGIKPVSDHLTYYSSAPNLLS
ncbi:hypothetical protein CROQUDRAFT_97091 [Cronartium quercuum f. sp. fusiforme G11]|uniref:Uncharacterized protein n=1 Tax=Cronartium quercuum f. sp. fusiforme G11 TaxID=708437 RepID=A0A9P6NA53_9BASI|nr:hypothetical protein CROQUDRAFT_97091 [Cronartium quercuum f. sp. fusiforme G11]